MSDALVVIQALATLASLGLAGFLAWLTVKRDREVRRDRLRDEGRAQVRELIEALRLLGETMSITQGSSREFESAQVQLAAALAINLPEDVPSIYALLDDDMPKPPYNFGEGEGWDRLQAALNELMAYSKAASGSPPS